MKRVIAGEKAILWRALRFCAQVIAGKGGRRFAPDKICLTCDDLMKHGQREMEINWTW